MSGLLTLPKRFPIEEFWDKVHQNGLNDCWEWQGSRNNSGYGQVGSRRYGPELAHRIAFMYYYGEIPRRWFVLHRCDNRACCNPLHLFLGNNRINMMDCVAKGRMHINVEAIRGEKNINAIYTEQQILEMHRLHDEEGVSGHAIARRLGTHKQHIYDILAWKHWKHLKTQVVHTNGAA